MTSTRERAEKAGARLPTDRPRSMRKDKTRPPAQPGAMLITLNGQSWTISPEDVTPRDAAALRRQTGFAGFIGLQAEISRGFDIDVLAALIWLARRRDGETELLYDQVLDAMSYDDDFDLELVDDGNAERAEAARPEA